MLKEDITIENITYHSLKDIARAYNKSPAAIRYYLRKYGAKKLEEHLLSIRPLADEEWRWITNYINRYQVSNKGRVMSFIVNGRNTNPHLLKPIYRNTNKQCTNNTAYYMICLHDASGKDNWKYIHRLVAETFIPNPNNLPQVNHKDGNGLNNCVENLEWCTGSENIQHALKMDNIKNTWIKLDYNKASEMRKTYCNNNIDFITLGKMYNVSNVLAANVIRNISWYDEHYIIPERAKKIKHKKQKGV